jgi:2-keto-4-pentenoate hydratase/2-oxohepta-3-ene-1,7-dioic acid hydratase in catechol pathway
VKLVTYRMTTPLGEQERYGALDDGHVVDLPAAYQAMLAARPRAHPPKNGGVLPAPGLPDTLLGLLRHEDAGMEAARAAVDFARAEGVARVALEHARLCAPLPRPNSIRDFMLVEEHVLNAMGEVPEEWYRIPVYWKANADTVFGPDDVVPWPAYTEKLDYELELCAVIGRRGKGIDAADAAAHIAGYSIFNDWSARDIQLREMSVGIGPGLGKDFATSIGPCLVTPDELDPQTAPMEARVNGEIWSQGTAGQMRFTFPEVIAHLSEEQELQPGDVLGSGTVGRGCGFELDRWLAPEDIVELEVEGIGVLRNQVRRENQGELT